MMKLTVAFLGALAAADAAEARSHRQARRQYYGGGYPHNGGNTAVSSVKPIETPKPVETPKVSATPSVPYVQSSADNFKPSIPAIPSFGASSSAAVPVSSVVVDGSSVPAVPVASSKPVDYGNGYGTTPASSSAKVPSNGVASSSAVVPSGVVPSKGVPSGVVPSSGAFSASSVAAVSSKVPSNSGVYPPAGGAGASGSVVPVYPTGTGSKPSATPVTDLVTKTIYSTQIYQISSKLVSTVVPVGTTVCPKDEASPTPAASVTPGKVYTSEVPISEITKKVTETLVYTVGVGSTAHPVTTEVVSTSTSTIYKTVVITLAKPTPTPGQGYPVGSNGSKPVDEETSTKTIKSTSTTTKYITVKPTPSGKVPVGAEGSPVPGGPAGGENCAVPVTVTVTAQETVYVTKGQDNSKPTPAPGKPSAPVPAKPEGTPVKPSGGAGVPTKPSAAPSGHYPYQNGTHPYPAGPTGFQTSAKPSVPVGTGGVPVPSKATSSLPAFSFVSEPVKTPSQETGVPVPSATPASASAPPAGGNYGNGYGASSAAPSSKVVVETPTPAVSTPAVPSSKVPSNEQSTPAAKPTPTPVGNGGYGNGYGTY